MIKKISAQTMKKLISDVTEDDIKWITVFNEIQSRIDVLFEALVSWYSICVFLIHIQEYKVYESGKYMSLGLKRHIYESYIFVELNNLLDPKGDSSITTFIKYWTNDINNGGKKIIEIFQPQEITFKSLLSHFELFNEWKKKNIVEIEHIKNVRDKNFSHIDYNYRYENKVSFEFIIDTIIFLSDYVSELSKLLNMIGYKIIREEPAGVLDLKTSTTQIEKVVQRFQQEIVLIATMHSFDNEFTNKIIFDCFDSIQETIKRTKLIKIR